MSLIQPIYDSNRMARRIREQRVAQGLTQAAVDIACDWPIGLTSHYENRNRLPGPEKLFTLCQVLQVPSDYILGLTDELP